MRIAIMQPYWAPYLGYFQLINSVDKFIVYDLVSYRKKTWMNHNYLLNTNGTPFKITIPVEKHRHKETINNIRYIDGSAWKPKFFSFVHHNYKRCTHYAEISKLLQTLFADHNVSLHQFNARLLIGISRYLDIKTNIIYDNRPYLDLEAELADKYNSEANTSLSNAQKKTERIIRICNLENCNVYINPLNGQKLYDRDTFKKHHIQLHFLSSNKVLHPAAPGFSVQDFSIIDTLMYCGKQKTKELLAHYTLL